MERLCVFPEDIARVTGRSLRYAQNLLHQLKIIYKKQKHQCITKAELAAYLGIEEKNIQLK